jgi:dCMP deaminase
MTGRPGWDEYFLGIARAVSARADCTRRQVGAVIVKDRRIVSTGYNGAPAGEPGCLSAGACPRGRHYVRRVVPDEFKLSMGIPPTVAVCACGETSLPCQMAVAEYSSYDNCIALHAETNAVVYAERSACLGATLYVTCEPCQWCSKVIAAAGIERVVTPRTS